MAPSSNRLSRRRRLRGIVLAVFVLPMVILGAFVGLFILTAPLVTGCNTRVVQVATSPDGRRMARAVERDCGSAISTSYVTIYSYYEGTGHGRSNGPIRLVELDVTGVVRDPTMSWDGNSHLMVHLPKRALVRFVRTAYRGLSVTIVR